MPLGELGGFALFQREVRGVELTDTLFPCGWIPLASA